MKVAISGSSSPFLKLARFHCRFWMNPPSVPMQVEMFLSQFHFLNSFKTLFNIILPVLLTSSEWFNLSIIRICNLFHAFYLLNLTHHSITLIILGRRYIFWNLWNGYSPGYHWGGGTEFDSTSIHVGIVVDKLAHGHMLFKYFHRFLSESFHITYSIQVPLKLNNVVIEGAVNTALLCLLLSLHRC